MAAIPYFSASCYMALHRDTGVWARLLMIYFINFDDGDRDDES